MSPAATPEAGALADRLVDHAGGDARWAAIEALEVRLRVTGLAFRTAGIAAPAALTEQVVRVHAPLVTITSRSVPGFGGTFDHGRVSTLARPGHDPILRENAVTRRERPWPKRGWDDGEAIAFCGYASWNYLTLPVLVRRPDVALAHLGAHRVDGEVVEGLGLTFGPDVPTHSPEQVLWVAADGAVRRLDYTALMISPAARAANRVVAETTAFGITVPTSRRVTPLLPGRRSAPGPLLVGIEIELTGVRER